MDSFISRFFHELLARLLAKHGLKVLPYMLVLAGVLIYGSQYLLFTKEADNVDKRMESEVYYEITDVQVEKLVDNAENRSILSDYYREKEDPINIYRVTISVKNTGNQKIKYLSGIRTENDGRLSEDYYKDRYYVGVPKEHEQYYSDLLIVPTSGSRTVEYILVGSDNMEPTQIHVYIDEEYIQTVDIK